MNIPPMPAGPRMVMHYSVNPTFLLEVTGAFDRRTQKDAGTVSNTCTDNTLLFS